MEYIDKIKAKEHADKSYSVYDGKEWNKFCVDFSPNCFTDNGCPRGERLKKVLSQDVIKLISNSWWK